MLGACSALGLLSVVVCTVGLDLSQIQVHPENAKVFIVELKHKQYSFNATTAADVCSAMNVTIASRADVESAMNNGFQTCRYGWVKEQVAIIPRIDQNPKCGQSGVGILVWRTDLSKLFEVFCFNSTGQTDERTIITTESDLRPEATTAPPLLTRPTLSNKNFLLPSTSVLQTSSAVSTSTPVTDLSSTAPVQRSTSSSPSSSSTPSKSTSSSHLMTSSSSQTTASNQTNQTQPQSPTRNSFGVPLACVIIAVTLLLMAGLGAVWYFKIKRSHRLPPWVRIRHKDAIDTEMWRHTDQSYIIKQSDNEMCAEDITLQMDDDTEPY